MQDQSETLEPFLTKDEAAALLGVSPSTVRRWIKKGDLVATRIGAGIVRISPSDLRRFIAKTSEVEA
jgi:excisionase family DNA binding protein